MGNTGSFSFNDLLTSKGEEQMNERDKRANRLKLNPRQKQTNSFRLFTINSKPATDIDMVEYDRINQFRNYRNKQVWK